MFRLTDQEFESLRSQNVTSKRAVLLDHKSLADKLAALERRVSHHDNSLAEVIDAIRALMAQPKPANRPIGFTADLADKPAKR